MDKEEYVARVQEQLADTTTYKCVPDKAKAIEEVTEAITNWATEFKEEPGMSLKLRNWIIPDGNCEPGNNYINPKAHKPEKGYPGRLISTGCSSFTKNLAALTAYELSSIKLDYVIKDTNHLLQKIDELNNNMELRPRIRILHVSFDVVIMFLSISKDVGLQQCRRLRNIQISVEAI